MEKNVKWFIELILSILLLIFTTLVTLMARAEEDRGLSVRAMGPFINDAHGRKTGLTAPAPAPADKPGAPPRLVDAKSSQAVGQAVATIGLWAARLDSKLTNEELDNVIRQAGPYWNESSQNIRKYLDKINDDMNKSGPNAVLQKALEGLGSAAWDTKVQVTNWAMDLMRNNGLTFEKIQQEVSRWASQIKLDPQELLKTNPANP